METQIKNAPFEQITGQTLASSPKDLKDILDNLEGDDKEELQRLIEKASKKR